MKKIFAILCTIMLIQNTAYAKTYHNIDIDYIYKTNDWKSKAKIKEIIDDYTLLLQYQAEFDNCPKLLPDLFPCYDKIAEKILTNLYVYPDENLKDYKQYKQALSEAYGMLHCRNKYGWPAGIICDVKRMHDMSEQLKNYIQSLLNENKENMLEFYPMLNDYKK